MKFNDLSETARKAAVFSVFNSCDATIDLQISHPNEQAELEKFVFDSALKRGFIVESIIWHKDASKFEFLDIIFRFRPVSEVKQLWKLKEKEWLSHIQRLPSVDFAFNSEIIYYTRFEDSEFYDPFLKLDGYSFPENVRRAMEVYMEEEQTAYFVRNRLRMITGTVSDDELAEAYVEEIVPLFARGVCRRLFDRAKSFYYDMTRAAKTHQEDLYDGSLYEKRALGYIESMLVNGNWSPLYEFDNEGELLAN